VTAPRARIIRDGDAEHRSGAGVELILAVSKESTGAEQLWFGRFTSEPGVVIPPHYHSCDTVAYLIRGRAAFQVGAERLEMVPGEYVYVPASVVHTEETVGSETAEFVIARDKAGGETVYLER
jgi:uncharacterized RmlC-like cupin family protein